MDQPDDRSLITACVGGDRNAWVLLVERYERLIYSIPLRYGLSESEAADIFQDVCLILLEKLEQLRDEARLSAWLATTTRRECWKVMRRRDAAGAEDPSLVLSGQPDGGDDLGEVVERWEAWQAIRAAMTQLGERCRLLLRRLYYTTPTPSYSVIASELGVPEGSIGPTRARCLKKLYHTMGGSLYRVEP